MSALQVVPNTADKDRPAEAQEIKRALQALIGSFPNSSKKEDLSIYAVSLFDDVLAARPTISTLAEACRRVRRSCDFLPSIKAVMDALDAVAAEAVAITQPADPGHLGEAGQLLLRKFGPAVFQSWFTKLAVIDDRGPELVLAAPSRFICSRIQRDFVGDILRYWQQVNPTIRSVRIMVNAGSADG
jgi:DnaA N-terminal domain